MTLCFVLLMATAMYTLAFGFLLILAIIFSPLVSLADGIMFHRMGYKNSKTKCFWDSMKLNLVMILAAFLWLLFIEEEYRFAIRYWDAIPLGLQLFLLFLSVLFPALLFWLFTIIEVRLIQFMNPAFPRSLIRKSMLFRYGLKALYLLVFILCVVWLDH